MPTPSAGRPRPPQSLEGTLPSQSNQGSLQGFDLSQIDPFFANAAQNLPEPELADVPNKPGFLPLLLSALGGGLSGDPNVTSDLFELQQNRIDEAEHTNRQLENQHQNDQFKLILAGRAEAVRVAELGADIARKAAEREKSDRLKEADRSLEAGRLALANKKFDQQQVDASTKALQGFVADGDSLAEQIEELTRMTNEAFNTPGASPPPFVLGQPGKDGNLIPMFHDIDALKAAVKTTRDDILNSPADPEHQKLLLADVDLYEKNFITDPLKGYKASIRKFAARDENIRRKHAAEAKRKEGIAGRKGKASLLASKAETVDTAARAPQLTPLPEVLRTPQQAGRAIATRRR